jgi:hypothetical protein
VSTRDIRASTTYTTCDVCGRTLLRGERTHVYLDGAARRSVCELCTSRALHEGWVREGTVPSFDGRGSAADRRRSLFGRLRARRESRAASESAAPAADELDGRDLRPRPDPVEPRPRERVREPRHVRAIPTSTEHKVASALDAFNGSEHPRTVAGVARSLGEPFVSVRPVDSRPSLVNVVVSWELCWYRYEVDLSEHRASVRVAAQGYELEELEPEEREANATADERGTLRLRS